MDESDTHIEKINTGQHVSDAKKLAAKMLRQTMTRTEKVLWQKLRAGRLKGFHFRRQQIIDSYIVDFYCHQAALVVEVDGDVHMDQQEHDRERDLYLTTRRLRILHFTNQEVNHNLDGVLSAILEACSRKIV